MSFRDVKIKIPDGEVSGDVSDVTHRKCGLRFESVEIETWARPDKFVRYGRRVCWVGVVPVIYK